MRVILHHSSNKAYFLTYWQRMVALWVRSEYAMPIEQRRVPGSLDKLQQWLFYDHSIYIVLDCLTGPQPAPDIRTLVTCKTRPLTQEISFCGPRIHLCRGTRKFTLTYHLRNTPPLGMCRFICAKEVNLPCEFQQVVRSISTLHLVNSFKFLVLILLVYIAS